MNQVPLVHFHGHSVKYSIIRWKLSLVCEKNYSCWFIVSKSLCHTEASVIVQYHMHKSGHRQSGSRGSTKTMNKEEATKVNTAGFTSVVFHSISTSSAIYRVPLFICVIHTTWLPKVRTVSRPWAWNWCITLCGERNALKSTNSSWSHARPWVEASRTVHLVLLSSLNLTDILRFSAIMRYLKRGTSSTDWSSRPTDRLSAVNRSPPSWFTVHVLTNGGILWWVVPSPHWRKRFFTTF